jgi:hypothetical protein
MRVRTLVLAGGLAASALPVSAADFRKAADEEWCHADDGTAKASWRTYCEVREATLPASGPVKVDATPNGGIAVSGWNGGEIRVLARVSARSDDASPKEVADAVRIEVQGTIHATGPAQSRHRGWDVSYRISTPSSSDLDLRSTNGGIDIGGVGGNIEFETMNGGVSVKDLAGRVHGRTTNGGVRVVLGGTEWSGPGFDVETTNGGVQIQVPQGYNAHLETGTVNGGIRTDIPVTVQGHVGHRLSTDLGKGGATVRAVTTNGGVSIRTR